MEQSELMRLIVQALESLEISYMITGSHASAFYGEPRFTKDIDIIADLKEERVDEFVKFFPADILGLRDIWDAVLRRVKE